MVLVRAEFVVFCVVCRRYPGGGGQILGQETWTTERHERSRRKSTATTSQPVSQAGFLSNLSLCLPHSLTLFCASSMPIKKNRNDLSMHRQHSAVSPPQHPPYRPLLCHTHSWQDRDRTCGRNEANGRGHARRERKPIWQSVRASACKHQGDVYWRW